MKKYLLEYSDDSLRLLTSKALVKLKIGRFSIEQYNDELFNQENIFFPDVLINSVRKRRAEYLAGRILARKALLEFEIHNYIIFSNHHRCPIWPDNIVGSISHSSSLAICIVANSSDYSGVGVDIETIFCTKTITQIRSLVFNQCEWETLCCSGISIELAGTIGFSAKESLFKALYPSIGKFFDFSAVKITHIYMGINELEVELTTDLNSRHFEGRKFKAHFTVINNLVVTLVTW